MEAKAQIMEAEILRSYLEADAPKRVELFRSFISAVKSLAKADRVDDALMWAKRAVSLDLDYPSQLIVRKILQLRPPPGETALRIAVLGGPTTTQIVWLLENFLAAAGIEAHIWEGDYGIFRQAIILPDAKLDEFKPQIIFLAVTHRDFSELPASNIPASEAERFAQDEAAHWSSLWKQAHDRWGSQIIQNLPETALPWNSFGHFGSRVAASRERYLARVAVLLAENAPQFVAFHNLQTLASSLGAAQWFDMRFFHEAKMPCGPAALVSYAHSVASVVAAIRGKSRKVIVLDLDNTLWGGVVGDDGVGGIRVGQGTAEGESYLAFQSYAKSLSERGVLLAVCSKNEMSNAREPFEKLPDMILKLSDFSSFVANWNNKADNIRAIAAELNLGTDSFVFVDDNPAERAIVRCFLPEVAVPDMPADPADYVQAVARHRYFETVSLTAEDFQRAQFYSQDRARRELSTSHTDVRSFLRSLDMKARIAPVGALNLERSVQLINKSNQFNLTTRRITMAEMLRRSESRAWVTLTISLRDKLGDNGLISVILAEARGTDLVIDTWVMSCRVLQRGVEQVARNALVDAARAHGCSKIVGEFIPTAKNGLVRDHFAKLGFAHTGTGEADATSWSLDVSAATKSEDVLIDVELAIPAG